MAVSLEASSELILYRSEDGRSLVQLRASDGTVWLSQAQIADLYQTSIPNVNQIVSRILADEELSEATINSELMVRVEGSREVKREVRVYNLDMVLAIGYRVTTARAVQFRQWASTVLREYLVKGFAINDEQLKQAANSDYFDELLERIRDIRASEARFYQKLRDLFAATSVDYLGTSDIAKEFFATVQNKLLFATTGKTAAELILERLDIEAANAGLTTWKGDRVRKADVKVAKNYLTSDEVSELNRLTTMFLDFAEDRASRGLQTQMADWVNQTNRFLEFTDRNVLAGAGSISRSFMEVEAGRRYEAFDTQRRAADLERTEAEYVSELHQEVGRIAKSLKKGEGAKG